MDGSEINDQNDLNMLQNLPTLSQEVVDENPYWQYKRDLYRLPDGTEANYYYASTHGSVFIVARNTDAKFVVVKQFRYLNQAESLEFPGGGLAQNRDPLEQAKTELEEESGFRAEQWSILGYFNPMNGLTNEKCMVYFADKLIQGEAKPEKSEEFEIHLMSEHEIDEAIASNSIWDGMTLAAWSLYKYRRI